MSKPRRTGWRRTLIALGLLTVLSAGLGLAAAPASWKAHWGGRGTVTARETWPVRRADLSVTMTAGGTVESANQTVIECQLERLDVNVRGNGYSAGGASTVLSLLPEGSRVKTGDVLCELDSSDYQELVRQEQMNVERARADYEQAVLNVDIAKMGVGEYRDGVMLQTLKDLRGRIALSESDWERARDRLVWSRQMLLKGYLAEGQVTTEEFSLRRIALTLTQGRTALRLFEKFSAPKYLRVLESDVLAAETVLNYQSRRLQRTEERLKRLQTQIQLCTIRAPHDGYLIYANEPRRNVRIEEGISVRQRQKLFYLPDLSRMQVSALIHESVVKDVQPGMLVFVSIEGLPDRRLEGQITKVAQLPDRNDFNDVKYFLGTVRLDNIPRGLMPGMSAQVEIQTLHRDDVLAIPTEALTIEDGREFCYVAHDESIERRSVTVGQATRDLLEVTSGLDEGDRVIVDPTGGEEPVVSAALGAAPIETVAAPETTVLTQ